MIRLLSQRKYTPIGIDVGSTSVKMVQFSGDGNRLIDAARWDVPVAEHDDELYTPERIPQLVEALQQLRETREFRGKEAVVCLNDRQLFIQSVRIPRMPNTDLDRLVQHEASGRLPYNVSEAEIRYISADDVRAGEQIMREVILLACHRPALETVVEVFDAAGLRTVAVDVEPCAVLRNYSMSHRRDEDKKARAVLVHVGYHNTAVMITKGHDLLFVKYIHCGGRHMDEAVARHLALGFGEAAALRRHNGDRRSTHQDPDVTRTVQEAARPIVEQLAHELAMCCRYYSVTFRGQPLTRLVLSGGEASPFLQEALHKRMHLEVELADPLRRYASQHGLAGQGPPGQWDVAAGLAWRGHAALVEA